MGGPRSADVGDPLSIELRDPTATQDSTHNQWMDVLFVTGWVGIALLVGLALVTILSSGSARAGVLLTLATIFMIGTTERAWSVGAIDLISSRSSR